MTPKVDNINTAKPIALASHTANVEEQHCPKNDLEVTVVDLYFKDSETPYLAQQKMKQLPQTTNLYLPSLMGGKMARLG